MSSSTPKIQLITTQWPVLFKVKLSKMHRASKQAKMAQLILIGAMCSALLTKATFTSIQLVALLKDST